jgi:hypothetical protein
LLGGIEVLSEHIGHGEGDTSQRFVQNVLEIEHLRVKGHIDDDEAEDQDGFADTQSDLDLRVVLEEHKDERVTEAAEEEHCHEKLVHSLILLDMSLSVEGADSFLCVLMLQLVRIGRYGSHCEGRIVG